MRVVVNAVSVREGGSRVVLIKLLEAMRRERPELLIRVAAPPAMCDELQDIVASCRPVVVGQSPLAIAKWYEWDLAATARDWRADVVFSMTNYLPMRRLPLPTLLLEQHAGHFSPTWQRLMSTVGGKGERITWGPRRRWVHRSVETATVLTVQTGALADAVAGVTRVPREQIRVVPHGPGWVDTLDQPPANLRTSQAMRIGFVSKAGIQKNFETLFKAAQLLSDRGYDIRLILTLDPVDVNAAATLSRARTLGIAHLIENHGEIGPRAILDLYDSLDVFVFPSLCESFGLPMVEAMARGLCIAVADTPENREVVGTDGLTFPALDADELATLLVRLCDDASMRRDRAAKSLRRARDFSWQSAAKGTIAALDEAVAKYVR